MTTRTIVPIRKWHEYTDEEFALFDALDALTTYAQARRAWERADEGGDFETFSHAESVMRKCSSTLIEIERERNRLRAALAAAPRWVSVTERPGPEGEGVMCAILLDNEYHTEARWLAPGWVVMFDPCAPFGNVTHWLELPPAPGAEVER